MKMKIFYDPSDNTIHLCIYCPIADGGVVGITEDESGRSELFSLTAEQLATFELYIIGEY